MNKASFLDGKQASPTHPSTSDNEEKHDKRFSLVVERDDEGDNAA
jgi:hypothetical protein